MTTVSGCETATRRLAGSKRGEVAAMAEKIALLGASSCDPLTSPMEARALLDALLSSVNPELTISGKKTMAIMTTAQIEKLF